MKSYGTRELIECLKCLGYKKEPQVGSRHLKYTCPNKNKIPKGQRPFIIVIQNRNTYDPITQKDLINEIQAHGFTEDQIKECID